MQRQGAFYERFANLEVGNRIRVAESISSCPTFLPSRVTMIQQTLRCVFALALLTTTVGCPPPAPPADVDTDTDTAPVVTDNATGAAEMPSDNVTGTAETPEAETP